MQLFFMVSTTQTHPVTRVEVNRTTTNIVIQRSVRKIGHGRQFGFEEMVLRKRERLFRAKVVGKRRVELLYIDKKNFLHNMSDADIIRYKKLFESYINFKQESHDIMQEMELKKRTKKAFLDGANLNPYEGRSSRLHGTESWFNPSSHGLIAQKKQNSVEKYVANLKSRGIESQENE